MRSAPAFLAIMLALSLTRAAGAMGLELWSDVDGTTYLINATAGPISFDGYQITSEQGTLDPVGWDSISDRIPGRITELIAVLGPGALTFGEANPGPGNLAELNLGGAATLAAGAKFSLGKPFSSRFDPTLQAYYTPAGSNNPVWMCPYPTCIPEPSTGLLALCGCGGALLLSRQRKKRPRHR